MMRLLAEFGMHLKYSYIKCLYLQFEDTVMERWKCKKSSKYTQLELYFLLEQNGAKFLCGKYFSLDNCRAKASME
jgi:hypothetical protein